MLAQVTTIKVVVTTTGVATCDRVAAGTGGGRVSRDLHGQRVGGAAAHGAVAPALLRALLLRVRVRVRLLRGARDGRGRCVHYFSVNNEWWLF